MDDLGENSPKDIHPMNCTKERKHGSIKSINITFIII